MIESMTGYGSGTARLSGNTVNVFLRSVNNRSFKLNIRLPDALLGVQEELEEMIRAAIVRGTVYCSVELDGPPAVTYSLDERAVLEYSRKLRALAKKAGAVPEVRLEVVAALPGVLREEKGSAGAFSGLLSKAAAKAVSSLVASRRREGKKIETELRQQLRTVVALTEKVAEGRARYLRAHRKKLAQRINELLSDTRVKVASGDVLREAAVMAERSDVAEELQRLGVHAQQMRKVLSGNKPAGRQLEFIAQEMLREANTMSAKVVSARLVVPLLGLKGAIDKIREQAQNVQ
jgi:uncharacterized protein (TIGR00255 family)